MCAWLSEGMSAAPVDELEVTGIQPPFARFDNFERLPTLSPQPPPLFSGNVDYLPSPKRRAGTRKRRTLLRYMLASQCIEFGAEITSTRR